MKTSTKNIPAEIRSIILAMSYDRNTFKNHVGEKIGGAIIEFYKARLARKAGKTQWVQHWETEVKQLLQEGLLYVLKHEVRGCRNKRKAVEEVIAYVKSQEESNRRSADYIIKKDYELTKLRVKIDDNDTKAFWDKVEEIVNISLL